MAQVIPLRSHTFRIDNCLIDDYGAALGSGGIATMAHKLGMSKNSVKKHLHHLRELGLISISPRSSAEGHDTSHLYTVHDPTQTEAVRHRQKSQSPGARDTSHVDPGDTSKFDPEQALSLEQDLLTRSVTLQIEKKPCDHPGHNHSSPFPGLQMCIECFRHWPVPLHTSSTAAGTAHHQHA